jgi:hypothetical protein
VFQLNVVKRKSLLKAKSMNNNYTTIALDENKERVNIEDAIKGFKYFCEGCGARKIAVTEFIRRDIAKYFKHHSKDVHIHHNTCKWSDENTLHKMAMDILQIKKYIKVPSVIKSSPDGKGLAYKIRDPKIIKAHFIENEMSYYEDNEGTLKWKRLNRPELELLKDKIIRPDVSFFDSNNMPILFIEIVFSNDISEEKYLKIKRFGIDTVKVIISTLNLETINKCFDTTTYTKWVFNNDEQRTNYISIPASSGTTVLSSDELEGGIYAENFNCRRNEIENFIRAVNRCLGQESYSSIKGELDRQLYELEEHSKRDSKRLRELQEGYEKEVEKEFESETSSIGKEETDITKSEGEFSNYNIKLEERYFKRKGELSESYNNYESTDQCEINRLEDEIRELEIYGLTIEERIDGIRREKERIENSINYTSFEIRKEEGGISRLEDRTRELSQQIIQQSEKFNQDRERIEGEFNRNREELFREFESKDFTGTSSIGKRIKEIIDGGAFIDIIEQGTRDFNELRIAQKYLKSEDWRNWDWS